MGRIEQLEADLAAERARADRAEAALLDLLDRVMRLEAIESDRKLATAVALLAPAPTLRRAA